MSCGPVSPQLIPAGNTGAMDSDDEVWDARYASTDQVWSGEPNGAVVTELTGAVAGRAVDVGCGEGADAVWLAQHGWQVTALDVSGVALQRAEQAAGRAGVDVHWVHAGLMDAELDGQFDLVSAQYPALPRTPDGRTVRTLLDLVAPGGILLLAHHADIDVEHAKEQGFDPADFISLDDVATALDEGWRVEAYERRPRTVTGGAG